MGGLSEKSQVPSLWQRADSDHAELLSSGRLLKLEYLKYLEYTWNTWQQHDWRHNQSLVWSYLTHCCIFVCDDTASFMFLCVTVCDSLQVYAVYHIAGCLKISTCFWFIFVIWYPQATSCSTVLVPNQLGVSVNVHFIW